VVFTLDSALIGPKATAFDTNDAVAAATLLDELLEAAAPIIVDNGMDNTFCSL